MIDLEAAQAFVAIAAAGNLSAAARARGIAQSTLSRTLDRLEAQVGTRLVERSSRAFRLTEAGERFAAGARSLLDDAERLTQETADTSRSAQGTLRLSLCPSLARHRLLRPTAAFAKAHPNVRILLELDDRIVDPVHNAIDVAIRVGALHDSELVCQRLGTYEHVLVGSPDYLRDAPPLHSPADLAHHALVAMRGARAFTRWGFARSGRRTRVDVRARIETNDTEALLGMTVAAAGITVLPDYLASEALSQGRLVRLLERWKLSSVPIFAVYASSAGLPRAARDWIAEVRLALDGSSRGGRSA